MKLFDRFSKVSSNAALSYSKDLESASLKVLRALLKDGAPEITTTDEIMQEKTAVEMSVIPFPGEPGMFIPIVEKVTPPKPMHYWSLKSPEVLLTRAEAAVSPEIPIVLSAAIKAELPRMVESPAPGPKRVRKNEDGSCVYTFRLPLESAQEPRVALENIIGRYVPKIENHIQTICAGRHEPHKTSLQNGHVR